MTTKIAIVGPQGSGKSTLIQSLCEDLKGKSVIVVEEVARGLNVNLNHDATIETQTMIWHEHLRREVEAMTQNPDYMICDRSLMDNLVYLRHLIDAQGLGSQEFDLMLKTTKVWMSTYDEIVRLPLNEDYITNADDDKRSKDLGYAHEIDALFDVYLAPYPVMMYRAVVDFS